MRTLPPDINHVEKLRRRKGFVNPSQRTALARRRCPASVILGQRASEATVKPPHRIRHLFGLILVQQIATPKLLECAFLQQMLSKAKSAVLVNIHAGVWHVRAVV